MSDPLEPGFLHRLDQPPRKVAVLRASRIGDFICAGPALWALRGALPQSEITLITLPMLEPLAARLPYIDRYLPFPGFPGLAEQFFDARKAAGFFREMQAEEFDLAIQMQGSGVNSNPFMLLLGASWTAGFIRPGDPPGLLDAALPIPQSGHEIRRVLALAEFLGAQARGEETVYPLLDEDRRAAADLLQSARPPLIGLHPAARDLTRRWLIERFQAVARELLNRHGGTLVILGDELARSEGGSVDARGWPERSFLDLTGKTSLPVLGAVIERLAILITNDSGPAHIAYALGTPTVTIFGGKDDQRYRALQQGPFRMLVYPVPCRPCTYTECPIDYLCLKKVGVDRAVDAALEVIRWPKNKIRENIH